MLPHVLMGEGYLARTPHPFESAGRPLCPLPQGERALEATSARLAQSSAARSIRAKDQPAGVENERRQVLPVSGLLFTGSYATAARSGDTGIEMCSRRFPRFRLCAHGGRPRCSGRAKTATCRCRKLSRSSVHCFRLFLSMEKATRACGALRCFGTCPRRRQTQYPTASAPRVRLSAAPTNPVGVTRIELADVRGKPSTTVWPRALSAAIRSGGNPCSTATSSGNH